MRPDEKPGSRRAFVGPPVRGTQHPVAETFEIRCGSRSVTHRNATTPQHAVIDYLRSLGSRDAELVRLAPGGVSWRGAVYTAVPLTDSARADAVPSESGRG